MPQMSPLNWIILFILFTLIYLMINIINYYNFNYKFLSKNKNFKFISNTWKW